MRAGRPENAKPPGCAGAFKRSPLPDSNRRPLPYHRFRAWRVVRSRRPFRLQGDRFSTDVPSRLEARNRAGVSLVCLAGVLDESCDPPGSGCRKCPFQPAESVTYGPDSVLGSGRGLLSARRCSSDLNRWAPWAAIRSVAWSSRSLLEAVDLSSVSGVEPDDCCGPVGGIARLILARRAGVSSDTALAVTAASTAVGGAPVGRRAIRWRVRVAQRV
jgi:hypothetical protein